jgi:Uncharacterized protein conserved in bacteria (DUF2188)
MTKIVYEVVEHDDGWAYKVDGVFSETFPSHDMARAAAERAAQEQVVAGDTTGISYEDKDGLWHDEVSAGDDRPETDVGLRTPVTGGHPYIRCASFGTN